MEDKAICIFYKLLFNSCVKLGEIT